MADSYQSSPPYNYTLNNPIWFIDPDGMALLGDYFDLNGNYLGKAGIDDDKNWIVPVQKVEFSSNNTCESAYFKNFPRPSSSVQ